MKVFLMLAVVAAYAQSPTFEVVSIRATPPAGRGSVGSGGGPGTKDPGTWTCHNMTLANIALIAFDLQGPQDLVAPGWMNDPRFDVMAKIPAARLGSS